MSEKIALVVSKDRRPRPEQEAIHKALLAGLEHRPELDVIVAPHLYDLAPDGPALKRLRSIQGHLIVLAWLYPRSAYWVLDANAVRGRLGRTSSLGEEESLEAGPSKSLHGPEPDRTIWCFDLRAHGKAESYLRQIDAIVGARAELAEAAERQAASGNGKVKELQEPTRTRWYPVIDLERCTNCKECLNFCLFGVYGLDQGGVSFVEQPDACRPGCPACARICPAGAIMFPQHTDPAIAGDPEASLQGMKLDLSQIFAGIDPAALAARERAAALAATQTQSLSNRPAPGPEKKSLDDLVDEVDGLDV